MLQKNHMMSYSKLIHSLPLFFSFEHDNTMAHMSFFVPSVDDPATILMNSLNLMTFYWRLKF